MADKTFKTKPGDEIIITVARRTKPATGISAPPRRKGIIEVRRPDDVLPRRLKKDFFINFYDWGRRKINNVWTDKIINYPVPTAEATLRAAMNDALATERAEWKNIFWKIGREEAEFFRFAFAKNSESPERVAESDEDWTAKGLKLDAEINRIRVNAATSAADGKFVFFDGVGGTFQNFDTASGVRVTNLPNFNAAVAEFNLPKTSDVNVFLNVGVFAVNGNRTRLNESAGYDWGDGTILGEECGWGTVQFPAERNTFEPAQERSRRTSVNSSHDVLHFGASFSQNLDRILNWRRSVIFPVYAEHQTGIAADNQLFAVLLAHYNARAYNVARADYGVTQHGVFHSFPNGANLYHYFRGIWRGQPDRAWADFPVISDAVSGGSVASEISEFTVTETDGVMSSIPGLVPTGTLLAAVNQGDAWFYIWKTSSGGL